MRNKILNCEWFLHWILSNSGLITCSVNLKHLLYNMLWENITVCLILFFMSGMWFLLIRRANMEQRFISDCLIDFKLFNVLNSFDEFIFQLSVFQFPGLMLEITYDIKISLNLCSMHYALQEGLNWHRCVFRIKTEGSWAHPFNKHQA